MSESKKQIGAYQVTGEIGRGAMGVVYRATHELTRKEVALKVVFENVAQSFSGAERFRREVSVSALVDDDGIVEIFDAGEFDGNLFYAMELLQGRDLEDVMSELPVNQVVGILADVATTAHKCHEVGIIHRDLKPENIYVREVDGVLSTKVLDFGIASVKSSPTATQTGFALGTPAYMSPEQAMAPKTAGGASDIWSIGVILYEACAGRLPFDDEAPAAVLMKVVHEAHPPLGDDVPEALAAIVERCMKKKPEERYESAQDLADDLRAYLKGEPVTATAEVRRNPTPTLPGTPTVGAAGEGAGSSDGTATSTSAPSAQSATPSEEFEPAGTPASRWVWLALVPLVAIGAWFAFGQLGGPDRAEDDDEPVAMSDGTGESAPAEEATPTEPAEPVAGAQALAEARTVAGNGVMEAAEKSRAEVEPADDEPAKSAEREVTPTPSKGPEAPAQKDAKEKSEAEETAEELAAKEDPKKRDGEGESAQSSAATKDEGEAESKADPVPTPDEAAAIETTEPLQKKVNKAAGTTASKDDEKKQAKKEKEEKPAKKKPAEKKPAEEKAEPEPEPEFFSF